MMKLFPAPNKLRAIHGRARRLSFDRAASYHSSCGVPTLKSSSGPEGFETGQNPMMHITDDRSAFVAC